MAYVAGPLAEMSCLSPATYTPPLLSDCGRQLTRNHAIPNRPANITCTTQNGYKVLAQWSHVNLPDDKYRLEAYQDGDWLTVQDDITAKEYERAWQPRKSALHRVITKRGSLLSNPSDPVLGRTRAQIIFQDAQGGAGVVDRSGNPIAGAEVVVYDVFAKAVLVRGLTDSNGKATFNEVEWPYLVLATADPMRDNAPVSVFADLFVSLSSSWVKLAGDGTLAIVSDAGAENGSALRVTGYAVIEHNQNIVIVEDGLYRMRVRLRQASDPTTGGKALYLGVSGVATNGNRININGENSFQNQHYFVANGDTLNESTSFTELIGYFWYCGTPAGGKKPNRSAPGLLYPQATRIRPMLIVNAAAGNGVVHIDYVRIERIAGPDAGTNENPAECWHHLVV